MLLFSDSHGAIEADEYIMWKHCTNQLGWSLDKTKKSIRNLIAVDLIHHWNESNMDYFHVVDYDEHQPKGSIRSRGMSQCPQSPCKTGGKCTNLGVNYKVHSEVTTESSTRVELELELELERPKGLLCRQADTVDEVNEVFNHWVITDVETGGGKALGRKLTKERRIRIQARLKEGYTVQQLKDCVTACCNDSFYLGENDRSRRFTDLKTLLGNADKVDRGLQIFEDQQKKAQQKGRYDIYTNPVAVV